MQSHYLLTGLTIGLLLTGCSAFKGSEKKSMCSESWYEFVESILFTGDSMGHGPDLGSPEWRSVVEFRLDLRDQGLLPDRSSDRWCEAIVQFLKAHDE
ncbi:hypothetical protein [Endozoicomonas sp. SESOKO2]|uniref:hypothetical protein n=1 Tax=Endozoicomonas sp. SESOKO2 TaxID=2828743 RepID=UPI0021482A65|nr:hypothetical protein [Endozoicomonas sp. SESOKO2]